LLEVVLMHVRATIRPVFGGYLAECSGYDAEGEGPTRAVAIEELRKALRDKALHPEAVALPPERESVSAETIDILIVPSTEQSEHDPEGPGEALAR
jgi:hypothetical protein